MRITIKEKQLSKKEVEEVVAKYKDLVYRIVLSKTKNHDKIERLLSCGFEGLIMAARRFDKSKNIKFITFAYHYVDGYVRLELKDKKRADKYTTTVDYDWDIVLDYRKRKRRNIEQKEVWEIFKTVLNEHWYVILYDDYIN